MQKIKINIVTKQFSSIKLILDKQMMKKLTLLIARQNKKVKIESTQPRCQFLQETFQHIPT